MRSIVSALLLCVLALVPCSQLRAVEKDSRSRIQLEVSLRDGSRVNGDTQPNRTLEITSGVIGKVSVPMAKISAITFSDNHEQVTVRLQNGDKLQGALSIESIKMTTVFGPVTLPLSVIKELQIHANEPGGCILGLDDWEPLPFPENSDWPAYRGERATITDGVVSLHGQPFRTKRTCSVPVTIEYDAVILGQSGSDGALHLRFVPPDEPRNMNLERYVYVGLNCNNTGSESLRSTPAAGQAAGSSHGRDTWRGEPFMLRIGKTYHIKVHATASDLTFSINDNEYHIEEVGVPYKEFLLDFWGWQPLSQWQLKNLKVY